MDILGQKQTATLDTKLGKIQVQIPSLSKKLDIERRRQYYSGGLAIISTYGADIADMFATFDIVVIDSKIPKTAQGDWDYDQIYDEDAFADAYKKAVEWLDSFRKPVAAEQKEMGQN